MQDHVNSPHWHRPPGWAKLGVPAGTTGSVLAFLLQRFEHVPLDVWQARFAQQSVRDGAGRVLHEQTGLAGVQHIVYPRHPPQEAVIPFEVDVLYLDADIVVVDKPHFLPVVPGGNFVAETLLSRMQQQLGAMQLAPLHRLDKDTAGLVLLSANPATRDLYHGLFRSRAMRKTYAAVAAAGPRFASPVRHVSRLEPGGARFFTMQEVPGAPNSETLVHMTQQDGGWGLYDLQPVSGKKHQLRVHMAALGVPIRHDPFYPEINDPPPGDFSRPLQLLARSLSWQDPVTGRERVFESRRTLQWPVAAAVGPGLAQTVAEN